MADSDLEMLVYHAERLGHLLEDDASELDAALGGDIREAYRKMQAEERVLVQKLTAEIRKLEDAYRAIPDSGNL